MQNIEHPFPKGTPLPKRHAVYPCPFILSFNDWFRLECFAPWLASRAGWFLFCAPFLFRSERSVWNIKMPCGHDLWRVMTLVLALCARKAASSHLLRGAQAVCSIVKLHTHTHTHPELYQDLVLLWRIHCSGRTQQGDAWRWLWLAACCTLHRWSLFIFRLWPILTSLAFASSSLFLSASVSVIHVPILVPIEPMLWFLQEPVAAGCGGHRERTCPCHHRRPGGREQEMMPLLGFLAKSRREAEFPTEILMCLGH